MDHRSLLELLRTLVSPETLDDTSLWGREIKILKQLLQQYPDSEFWTNHFKTDRYVKTMLWFKTGDWAMTLEREWRLYTADINQKVLDITTKVERVEDVVPAAAIVKPTKKKTAAGWADEAPQLEDLIK